MSGKFRISVGSHATIQIAAGDELGWSDDLDGLVDHVIVGFQKTLDGGSDLLPLLFAGEALGA